MSWDITFPCIYRRVAFFRVEHFALQKSKVPRLKSAFASHMLAEFLLIFSNIKLFSDFLDYRSLYSGAGAKPFTAHPQCNSSIESWRDIFECPQNFTASFPAFLNFSLFSWQCFMSFWHLRVQENFFISLKNSVVDWASPSCPHQSNCSLTTFPDIQEPSPDAWKRQFQNIDERNWFDCRERCMRPCHSCKVRVTFMELRCATKERQASGSKWRRVD